MFRHVQTHRTDQNEEVHGKGFRHRTPKESRYMEGALTGKASSCQYSMLMVRGGYFVKKPEGIQKVMQDESKIRDQSKQPPSSQNEEVDIDGLQPRAGVGFGLQVTDCTRNSQERR